MAATRMTTTKLRPEVARGTSCQVIHLLERAKWVEPRQNPDYVRRTRSLKPQFRSGAERERHVRSEGSRSGRGHRGPRGGSRLSRLGLRGVLPGEEGREAAGRRRRRRGQTRKGGRRAAAGRRRRGAWCRRSGPGEIRGEAASRPRGAPGTRGRARSLCTVTVHCWAPVQGRPFSPCLFLPAL